MTEEGRWTRDETPYVIFNCSKCNQYSYVKTTQKTKKCLRCGRTHQVQRLLLRGEIVKGMTSAVQRVKALQDELARTELGKPPDLVSDQGFTHPKHDSVIPAREPEESPEKKTIEEFKDYYPEFLAMLKELSTTYKEFPLYMIKMMAEHHVPPSLLLNLLRKAIKEDMLCKHGDLYFLNHKG